MMRRPHLERVSAWKVVHPLMPGGTLRATRKDARIVLRRLKEMARAMTRTRAGTQPTEALPSSETTTTRRMLGVVPDSMAEGRMDMDEGF